jgi:hypothetical protein
MNYISEHKIGLIGTTVTHAVILGLLLFFGFFTPLPLPPNDEGVLVNFGDSENGLGLEEPAPGESAPVKGKDDPDIVQQTPPPPAKNMATQDESETLLTQDREKTVAVESAKKKSEVVKAKDPEKEKLLKEKREQQELEKQQHAEIARLKKEEEQRLALAAAEQRKAGEINNRVKNAFGGNGNGTNAYGGNGKGAPDSRSGSQGVTFGNGNQGVPGGSANVDKYGPGGGVGNGPSFSLSGRNGLLLPKPNYPGNEEGIVVVQVTVDKNGIVQKAEPGVKGTNTANPELITAARKAALQAKFNVDNNAPAFQVGTITYRFRLD